MEGEDYEHITPEDLTSVDMNVRGWCEGENIKPQM